MLPLCTESNPKPSYFISETHLIYFCKIFQKTEAQSGKYVLSYCAVGGCQGDYIIHGYASEETEF